MRAKNVAVIGLVAGLIVGSLAVSAEAKKKPKKKPKKKTVTKIVPVDAKFFLRRADCGGADDQVRLSIVDGTDEGNGCGSYLQGSGNEVMIAAGDPEGLVDVIWTATDGIPFVLDVSKELKGAITLESDGLPPAFIGAGPAELEVILTGTSGGATKTLGSAVIEHTVTPGEGSHTYEFSLKLDAALAKAQFSSLDLVTRVRGAAANHGFFELDDPASYITIPTLVTTKK